MSTQDDSQLQYRSEYQHELEVWLRRRFRILCIIYLALGLADIAWGALFGEVRGTNVLLISMGAKAASVVVISIVLFGRNWTYADRAQIVRGATRMILVLGVIWLAAIAAIRFMPDAPAPRLLLPLFFWHITACLFLPWTPRESMRPFTWLFVGWALMVLIFPGHSELVSRVLMVIFGPAIFLPGLGIAAWRMDRHRSRFRRKMVGQQFVSMRQEFSRARSIHESLFPPPYDDGFVRFEYDYTPMRELGGDYVHLYVGPSGLVHLTLLDVTGHGLAAALTVNRLYGEIERIRAENPRAQAGEVLALLNRYIHLTMARHNIYATAACYTFDPYLNELRWASAGHPPGFLRDANGKVRPLDSTCVLLGAIGHDDFDPDQQALPLCPGDTLVVYTDGTFESRNTAGEQYGLKRMEELLLVQPPPKQWSRYVANNIDKHRAGRTEDDVLVASLTYLAPRRQDLPMERRDVSRSSSQP